MTDLSISTIEGMDKTQIVDLKNVAYFLHESVTGILNTPMSAQDAEREEQLRSSLVIKLAESINWIDQQMSDLDALKRDLRIVKSYQSSDRKRIESYKIGIYIQQKELRQRP